jgi:hypothetical protein
MGASNIMNKARARACTPVTGGPTAEETPEPASNSEEKEKTMDAMLKI